MFKTMLAAVGCAVVVAVAAAAPAQAAPYTLGQYPNFTYEGRYPKQTPCWYHVQQSKSFVYKGRTGSLKLYYSSRCGAFARIDNADRACVAVLKRTLLPAQMGGTTSTVMETVDPGINYAYTKVANNLGGRVAQASVVCGGVTPAALPWF